MYSSSPDSDANLSTQVGTTHTSSPSWWHTLTKPRTIPGIGRLETLARRFTPAERLLVYLFTTGLIVSAMYLLATANEYAMVEQPAHGGQLVEGVVGTPRFVNPLLAVSDADRDLTQLVYSGLLRATPDGGFIPDTARSYDVSDDGLTYTFTIREDATFHDGTPVTADDVAYTIATAQNPDIKSPKRANWDGVTVTVLDAHTVEFQLTQPYAPFLENTTIGILPAHLWQDVTPDEFPFHQLNTRPVGSGPFEIARIDTTDAGSPTRYVLRSFTAFSLGEPFLDTLILRFYPNESALIGALERGEISALAGVASSQVPNLTAQGFAARTAPLPRVFAVFFNQNRAPVLLDSAVREALDVALDKNAIVSDVLAGYGTPLGGPIPPGVLTTGDIEMATTDNTDRLAQARDILIDAGWEQNEETGVWEDEDGVALAFTLTTADTPELAATAELVAGQWRALGADVSVQAFGNGTISSSVIRPREYDALLFGEIVGRTLDLFAFWHSTQRNDPGLNLALYTNAKADTLLSDARTEHLRDTREALYREFALLVQEDIPATFLYAPDFIYVTPTQLKGIELGALTTPAERFLNVHEWHRETESVWHVFSHE